VFTEALVSVELRSIGKNWPWLQSGVGLAPFS